MPRPAAWPCDTCDRLLSPGGLLCSAAAEARIFSEAGFRSLGGECPFAFRRQDDTPICLRRRGDAASTASRHGIR